MDGDLPFQCELPIGERGLDADGQRMERGQGGGDPVLAGGELDPLPMDRTVPLQATLHVDDQFVPPVRLVLDSAGSVLVSFFSAADRKPLVLESFELRITNEARTASGSMAMNGGSCRTARILPRAPGMYTLVVRARGYEDITVKGVDVRSDREAQVEVLLRAVR